MKIDIFKPESFCELGKRQEQEDAIRPYAGSATTEDRLFVLCDGMGGSDDGEIASNTVADALVKYFNGSIIPNKVFSSEDFHKALSFAYNELDKKDNGKILNKMGTTLCLLYTHTDGVFAAHIGDSRIYQIRPSQRRIIYKSRDHSKIMDMMAIGAITPEQAKNAPYKNVVTRIMQPLSVRDKAEECTLTDIKSGDYFLLCSDGVLENIEDSDIVNLFANSNLGDSQKREDLEKMCAINKDNHSAHIIHIKSVEEKFREKDCYEVPKNEVSDFRNVENCHQMASNKTIFTNVICIITIVATIVFLVLIFL